VVAPVDIGKQVLELDRSNLDTVLILAFYGETGDASVGKKLEASFECWFGVDLLKDSIGRVPVDVVGILLCKEVTSVDTIHRMNDGVGTSRWQASGKALNKRPDFL
jgi:hypothetical protein